MCVLVPGVDQVRRGRSRSSQSALDASAVFRIRYRYLKMKNFIENPGFWVLFKNGKIWDSVMVIYSDPMFCYYIRGVRWHVAATSRPPVRLSLGPVPALSSRCLNSVACVSPSTALTIPWPRKWENWGNSSLSRGNGHAGAMRARTRPRPALFPLFPAASFALYFSSRQWIYFKNHQALK